MKRFLVLSTTLLLMASLTFAAESKAEKKAEKSSTGVTISKGDSFMAAFGMGDSVAGGEAGTSSSAGSAAVAGNLANRVAAGLTSSQNTPYSYKK
ncbi:MAG: hypothetical protein ACRDAS_05830 [Cetobacterium sp.]